MSCNRRAARSLVVMLHVWYAIAFQFDSHLGDFPFFYFFKNFPKNLLLGVRFSVWVSVRVNVWVSVKVSFRVSIAVGVRVISRVSIRLGL